MLFKTICLWIPRPGCECRGTSGFRAHHVRAPSAAAARACDEAGAHPRPRGPRRGGAPVPSTLPNLPLARLQAYGWTIP